MKFSVIVPVYNAGKYIHKCILSVLHQSCSDWELILVDDGSEDDSSKIIDEYAAKDGRIIAIHQQNAGPGIARNNGIKRATGDYIVFLDSDDYIEKDYFTLLAPKAEKVDVVFIDVLQIAPDGKVLSKELMSEYKGWSKDKILRSQMTGKIPWGGVRKTARRSILVDNDIKYTDHKVGEEALYSFRVVHAAKSVYFLDEKPVYYYVNHEGSQSKTIMEDPWGGVATTISKYLKDSCLYEEFANTVNAFEITAAIVSVANMSKSFKGADLRKKCLNRVNTLNEKLDRNYAVDYGNMMKKACILSPFINERLYFFIIWCSRLRS